MVKTLRFIKKIIFAEITFFSCSALKCVSMSNQDCKRRPAIINTRSNKPLSYSYSILVNKCSGSYKDINNPQAKLCIHVVENWNIKVFSLMSRINKTRNESWHKTCKCKCRLDGSLYVIIMSHMNFRVNPDSIVCLNVKELLAQSRRHI